jgi:hypothetical protein
MRRLLSLILKLFFLYISNVEAVVNDNDMEKGNNENLNEGAFFDEWETSQRWNESF